MLKKLSLVNFQKHRSFEHKFTNGLTVCFGGNWAGKSTVLRGLLYALFGTSAVPVKAANLATRGEKGFLVTLEFEVAGISYTIERGKTKAALYRDTHILATGHTQVTQEVERLIGATARNFLTFNVAQQDEAGALLSLGAQKLGQHLADITGVTVVDDVIERARDRMVPLRDVSERMTGLYQQLDQENQRLAALSQTVHRLGQELQAQGQAFSVAKFSYEEACRQANLLRDRHSRYVKWQSDYTHLSELVEQYAKQRSEAQQSLDRLGGQPDVDVVWSAYSSLTKQKQRLDEYESKFKELMQVKAQGTKTIEQIDEQLSQNPAVKDLAERTDDYGRLADACKAKLAELDSAQKSVKGSVCHACKRPFNADEHRQAEQRLEKITEDASFLQRQVEQRSRELARLKDQHHRRTALEANRTQWVDYVKNTEKALRALTPVEPVSEEALSEARRAYESAAQAKGAWAAAEHALRVASDSEAGYRAKLEQLEPAIFARNEDVLEAEGRADHERAAYQQAFSSHSAVQQQYNQAVFEQRAATDTRAALQAQLDSLSSQAHRLEKLTELVKYLKANRDRFVQQTWQDLLGYASEFVSEATAGDIKGIARSEQGEFVYLEDGQEMPIELASGMQRAILGVAVKLAMSAALGSSFPVLLLDEVSAAASDENSLILTDLLARTGQQVFLVTHRQADSAVAESVLAL